jgi:hypothetical protein
MTKSRLFILMLLTFAGCKKENNPVPSPEVASIVGKWRAVEYRQSRGDSTITQPLTEENSWVYEFRFDGVVLNERGYVPCCLPSIYYLNGKEFRPDRTVPAELDPSCAYSLCVACPEMKITQTSPDSLTIENCKNYFTTFVRKD